MIKEYVIIEYYLRISHQVKINTADGMGERQIRVPQEHSFVKKLLEVVWLIYHMMV